MKSELYSYFEKVTRANALDSSKDYFVTELSVKSDWHEVLQCATWDLSYFRHTTEQLRYCQACIHTFTEKPLEGIKVLQSYSSIVSLLIPMNGYSMNLCFEQTHISRTTSRQQTWFKYEYRLPCVWAGGESGSTICAPSTPTYCNRIRNWTSNYYLY